MVIKATYPPCATQPGLSFGAVPLAPHSLLALPLGDLHFTAHCPVGFDGHRGPNAGAPICYLTYFPEAQEHQVTCTRSPMSQ